jgi:hypothetical protein
MTLLAQVADVATANAPLLYTYGPMGIVLGWFMLRGEKLIVEIRSLSSRIDSLTRALLVDTIDRDTCGEHAKQFARDSIAQIDSRDTHKHPSH